MLQSRSARHDVEILEQRIAPAGAALGTDWKQATFGANLLHAGQGLTTGNGNGSGHYLIYDQAGDCIVFITDLNNNSVVDFNEVTGISAGDGLQLISFVDIHGDIVTNLTASDTLSDSDHNATNNDPDLKGDGLVLLNSTIKSITLRSVQASDFTVNSQTDPNGTGSVDPNFLANRLALSSYSIFGNIYAGKGFGAVGGGLTIDTSGAALQASTFVPGNTSSDYYVASTPSIGSIVTGSAAGGQTFWFSVSNKADVGGQLLPFVPPTGQNGGDIIGVTAADTKTAFNINSLLTGNGGIGARGGNIQNVQLNGDSAGYQIIAGDGGKGTTGGAGGSILNFADLNSVTSEIILKTGNGGEGATGVGGAGGTLTLGTLNVAANLNIELGNGGKGFTGGGNGASFPSGTITTPEGGVPYGLDIAGTMHTNYTVGTQTSIDFNGDGVGDFVYTSSSPDQLVAVLPGVGKYYLDGVSNGVVTVGDFNDDGLPDIAVASKDAGWGGGVEVFLNKGNDASGNFLGFSLGHYSPLPALDLPLAGYLNSSNAISGLVTGDFNGDGHTDIGVMATYYSFDGGSQTNIQAQVLIVLTNDVENGRATGSFYADFGTKNGVAKTPYTTIYAPLGGAAPGTVIIESSALSSGAATDTIFTGIIGKKTIDTYSQAGGSVLPLGSYVLGKIDTNRDILSGTTYNISASTDALVQDFTILDFASPSANQNVDPIIPGAPDGIADVVDMDPTGYLVTVAGDGTGKSAAGPAISNPHGSATIPNPAVPANPPTLPNANQNQNSGIYFGAPANGHGGFNNGTQIVAIKSTIDGRVAILNYSPDTAGDAYRIHEVSLTNTTGAPLNNGLGKVDTTFISPLPGYANDPTVIAFDSYNTGSGQAYLVADPNKVATFPHNINISSTTITASISIADNADNITAGNGGDGLVGKGGTGGFIGGGLKGSAGSPVGAVSITFPADIAFGAEADLVAGDGGKGFAAGGNGGSITGVSVRYAATATVLSSVVTLTGGDGGTGVAGAGGSGGNLAANTIQTGTLFVAGNGGSGLTGGNGGSVTGNGVANLYDTNEQDVEVISGSAGAGVTKGGAGGDISGFHATFPGKVGAVSGSLIYVAGDGGTAVAGPGGRGGGVINSSPLVGVNAMGGEIYIQGGTGGGGTIGGAGGSITNFADNPSTSANPTLASFIAGNGGAGTSGAGGVGGAISNVTTPTVGTPGLISGYTFNRAVAGNGGSSAGAAGGAGGAVNSVSIGSSDAGIVIVGGAGGSGLTAGGVGGSVTGSTAILSAGDLAKVLVIAGAGGDAYAFMQNPLDNPPLPTQKPFGGRVGQGGNGGSITGFSESTDVLANVDLIAGNGGSTVNYGTITDAKSYVGKGGSITNVTVAGNIGNGDASTPIKSYTDTNAQPDGIDDTTIAAFVQANFRIAPGVGGAPALNDQLGNVGAVVGVAGQIKQYQTSPGVYTSLPAKGGVNGSFTNISARNLLSAVAGSVNQIAAIQVVSGVKIGSGSGANFIPGVIGADKDPSQFNPIIYTAPYFSDPTPGSNQDYYDQNGQGVTEPVLNGRLIDGAIVAHTIVGTLSGRVFVR